MATANSSSSSPGDSSSSDDEEQVNNTAVKSQTPKKQHKKLKEASSSSSSSSESEENEAKDDEETSDDDEEEEEARSKAVKPTQPKPASESSDSGPESDSGSGSESEPPQVAAPVSSKPLNLSGTDNTKSPSHNHFQRFWSLDDEITILNSLLKYQEKHGPIKLNTSVTEKIHSNIAKSLSFNGNEGQFFGKIRSLREAFFRKYRSLKGLRFKRPHDKVVYELSEKIWGNKVAEDPEAGGKSSKKADRDEVKVKTGDKKANGIGATVKGGEKGLKRKFIYLEEAAEVIGNQSAGKALERINPEQVLALEKDLRKVSTPQVKHKIRQLELIRKSFELVLEGVERSVA